MVDLTFPAKTTTTIPTVVNPLPPGTRVVRESNTLQPHLSYRHTGEVLAVDSPEAWVDTIAFYSTPLTQENVTAHVLSCQLDGLLLDRVPVRWSFGKIYFETASTLVKEPPQ